jgi:hypothetical protein
VAQSGRFERGAERLPPAATTRAGVPGAMAAIGLEVTRENVVGRLGS